MSDPSKPFGSRHTHRARIAAMSRANANRDEIEDVRILLRSARLAEYVQTALDLPIENRRIIAALLTKETS